MAYIKMLYPRYHPASCTATTLALTVSTFPPLFISVVSHFRIISFISTRNKPLHPLRRRWPNQRVFPTSTSSKIARNKSHPQRLDRYESGDDRMFYRDLAGPTQVIRERYRTLLQWWSPSLERAAVHYCHGGLPHQSAGLAGRR